MGLPPDHPSRIEAGVVYALNQASDDGHVYLPRAELVEGTCQLLDVPADAVPPALERLEKQERIQQDFLPFSGTQPPQAPTFPAAAEASTGYGAPAIYLAPLYISETSVAERLRALAKAIPSRLSDLPPAFITLDPALSAEQQAALRTCLSHPLSVLTGGPGTGKTTALQALIVVLESARKTYALASPTGRAAKRLSQATGRPASTLHRLLALPRCMGF